MFTKLDYIHKQTDTDKLVHNQLRLAIKGGTRRELTLKCRLSLNMKHICQDSRIIRWIVRHFQIFVVSAARICKQCLQTALASGGLRPSDLLSTLTRPGIGVKKLQAFFEGGGSLSAQISDRRGRRWPTTVGVRKLIAFSCGIKYQQYIVWFCHKARVWQTDGRINRRTELRLPRFR